MSNLALIAIKDNELDEVIMIFLLMMSYMILLKNYIMI